MNRVTAVNKRVLRGEFELEVSLQNKTRKFYKKNNECDECHFLPFTKTAKYFENQFFNGVKCLTDKCTSFVYNLLNVENGKASKNEGTNSNSEWNPKWTTCLSYLLELFKLSWCATNETSQKINKEDKRFSKCCKFWQFLLLGGHEFDSQKLEQERLNTADQFRKNLHCRYLTKFLIRFFKWYQKW